MGFASHGAQKMTNEDQKFETAKSEYEQVLKKRFANNPDAAYNYLRSLELECLESGDSTHTDSNFQKALTLVAEARSLQKFQVRDLFMEGRETWNQKLK